MGGRTRLHPIRRKAQQTERVRLEVKACGPIDRAVIHGANLTIFIGHNSTGKSFVAKVLGIMTDVHDIVDPYRMGMMGSQAPLLGEELDLRPTKYFEKWYGALTPAEPRVVPQAILKTARGRVIRAIERRISERFWEAFESTIYDDDRESQITLTQGTESISVRKTGLGFQVVDESLPQPQLNLILDDHHLSIAAPNVAPTAHVGRVSSYPGRPGKPGVEDAFAGLVQVYANLMVSGIPRPIHYIPAGRTGILDARNAIAGILIATSSRMAGVRAMDIPTLSPHMSRFLSRMVALPVRHGPLGQMCRAAEQRLLGGQIVVEKGAEAPLFYFKQRDRKLPIEECSSAITELQPIFTYISYYVRPGDMLVVEEPEAHLHPANQRLLARFLAALAEHGVRLIVTTHSDFLVEQLNNVLMEAKTNISDFGVYDKQAAVSLGRGNVAAFRFKRRKPDQLSRAVRIRFQEKRGLAVDDFSRVAAQIYDEAIGLDSQ